MNFCFVLFPAHDASACRLALIGVMIGVEEIFAEIFCSHMRFSLLNRTCCKFLAIAKKMILLAETIFVRFITWKFVVIFVIVFLLRSVKCCAAGIFLRCIFIRLFWL